MILFIWMICDFAFRTFQSSKDVWDMHRKIVQMFWHTAIYVIYFKFKNVTIAENVGDDRYWHFIYTGFIAHTDWQKY